MSDAIKGTQLEAIAERALTFQRYILRRAWGIYYAVWTVAFAAFVLINFLPIPANLSQNILASELIFGTLYGSIGLAAGVATIRIFGNAHRTLRLHRILTRDRQGKAKTYSFLIGWWASLYVIIALSFAFFGQHALSVLFASLFSVEIFIYYQMRISFPNRMPFEGKVALLSYGFGTTFSFLTSLFIYNSLIFTIGWGSILIVWLFCALYALRHASEELAALSY